MERLQSTEPCCAADLPFSARDAIAAHQLSSIAKGIGIFNGTYDRTQAFHMGFNGML